MFTEFKAQADHLIMALKRFLAAYMHQQACAFARQPLPTAPLEEPAKPASAAPVRLKFPDRSRLRLGWFLHHGR